MPDGTKWHLKLGKEEFGRSIQGHWRQKCPKTLDSWMWAQIHGCSCFSVVFSKNSLNHTYACPKKWTNNEPVCLWVCKPSRAGDMSTQVHYSHSYLITKECPRGNWFTYCRTRLALHSSLIYCISYALIPSSKTTLPPTFSSSLPLFFLPSFLHLSRCLYMQMLDYNKIKTKMIKTIKPTTELDYLKNAFPNFPKMSSKITVYN